MTRDATVTKRAICDVLIVRPAKPGEIAVPEDARGLRSRGFQATGGASPRGREAAPDRGVKPRQHEQLATWASDRSHRA